MVIGNYLSSNTVPLLEKLSNGNILYITPTASADDLLGIDDYLIRMNSNQVAQINAFISQIGKSDERKFIIFKDSSNMLFTFGLSDLFANEIKKIGGTIVSEITYDGTETINIEVINETINKYKDIDGVFLSSDSVNASIILKTIKSLGYNPNFYLIRWGFTSDFLSLSGDYANGVYSPQIIVQDSKSQKYIDFANEFKEYYGTNPTFSSVLSYEAMMMLAEAIEKTKSTKPNIIKKYILEKKTFDGLQTPYSIDEFGDCDRDNILVVIENGLAVSVEKK